MPAQLRPGIAPEPINPQPQKPVLTISPATASVSLSSGQAVTVGFELGRYLVESAASLDIGSLPAGLTAELSATSLPESSESQSFSLTVTAAQDVTPVAATIEISAAAGGLSAIARVAVNAVAVAQLYPAYQVLSVLYTPPGTALGTPGSKSDSQVVYSTSSSTGTTVSASASFKAGIDVTATAGANLGVGNFSASSDFNASVAVSGSDSVTVTKTENYIMSAYGAQQDGIDHGNDFIYLWLNPAIGIEVDASGAVTWELGINASTGDSMVIQFVLVSWLNTPSTMPSDVSQMLTYYGVTPADYPQIAACDPFSSGAATIDPNRFLQCPLSFPYEPLTGTGPLQTTTYTLTDTVVTTTTTEVSVQFGVTYTLSVGASAVVTASLKEAESLEITASATATTTESSGQTASVTVGNPSSTYPGSTDVLVYWDTVFSTFMFAFVPETATASVTGQVAGAAAGTAVTLTVGGVTWTTWTDSSGKYRFYDVTPGDGALVAGTDPVHVTVPPPPQAD